MQDVAQEEYREGQKTETAPQKLSESSEADQRCAELAQAQFR